MSDVFVDATTLPGQQRIREYVIAWLERLDYSEKLDRSWPADELGARIWNRVDQEFAAVWDGPVTDNRAIAEVIATIAVEDYYEAVPQRLGVRFSVSSPFGDASFRRCALDFVHDLEEYEPNALPTTAEEVAEMFWHDVHANPDRWGCKATLGPLVDDEGRAREIATETIREYFTLREQLREMKAG
jgi:hypothetical protein